MKDLIAKVMTSSDPVVRLFRWLIVWPAVVAMFWGAIEWASGSMASPRISALALVALGAGGVLFVLAVWLMLVIRDAVPPRKKSGERDG